MNIQHLINKSIRDRSNKVVIWQRPNLLIIGWFVCAIAARLFRKGDLHAGLSALSTALLFVWAYLEIAQGASYFRRILGLIIMTAIIIGHCLQ